MVCFFLTLLTSLCTGDTFKRASTYCLWSLLAPVGHARDPLTNFGYSKLPATTQNLQEREERKRSSYFVICHILSRFYVYIQDAFTFSWVNSKTDK